MGSKKKHGWGGARAGAGRPKGSGPGPSPDARTRRIAVMLNCEEVEKLAHHAKKRDLPVATLAYQLLARALANLR